MATGTGPSHFTVLNV